MIDTSNVAPRPLARSTGSESSSDILGTSSSSLSSSNSTSVPIPKTDATTSSTKRGRALTTNVRRGTRITNPIFYSMISSNNMTDCLEIRDLYAKCSDVESFVTDSKYHHSSPQQPPIICETAHKLFVSCHVSDK
uniref:Uncharacterized protein n=1 Tax=Minutocellus polymorphus TaxID=265543 RepID=A0A7S0AI67_9STRA|mmetsp:Transcript_14819/g.24675  ORF Transcript_14819/g.24675 Transcript_14819/m.24675 type:complete len:135 (+) Transcript_14819:137-541(+)